MQPNLTNKKFRFRLLIYPQFQLILIFINLISLTGIFFFIDYKIAYFFNYMRQLGEDASFEEGHTFYKFVALQEATLQNSLFHIALFSFIFSTLIFLLLSHKISGPIIRLKSYFTSIAETGLFEKLQFRKRDFFTDLPMLINEALDTLSNNEEK